jgi:hypothetical protein
MGGTDRAANYGADEDEGQYGDPDDAPFATIPRLHLLSHGRSSIRGFRDLVNGNGGPNIFCAVIRDRRGARAIWSTGGIQQINVVSFLENSKHKDASRGG